MDISKRTKKDLGKECGETAQIVKVDLDRKRGFPL
jgi:hypothetical protein